MSLADRLNAARNRRPAPGLPDVPAPAEPLDDLDDDLEPEAEQAEPASGRTAEPRLRPAFRSQPLAPVIPEAPPEPPEPEVAYEAPPELVEPESQEPLRRATWMPGGTEVPPVGLDSELIDPAAAGTPADFASLVHPAAPAEPASTDPGYAEQPYAEQPYAEQGYAEQGYAEQPYAEQGYAEQGYAEQPYAEQGYAEQSYAEPAVLEPASEEVPMTAPGEYPPAEVAPVDPSALQVDSPAAPSEPSEPEEVANLRVEASELLAERLGSRFNDRALTDDDLLAAARRELASIIDERGSWLPERKRLRLIKEIADDALGLGPLQELLDDPTVTEIMVNGPSAVYIERGGRIIRSHVSFRSEARLRRVIERIVSRVGRRIDESSPLVDARLPDGSRVNAIIPPLVVGGSSLTIRKFAVEPFQAGDLVSLGTITRELAELLVACVQAHLNIVISGGTGTGKTTLLNVLSSFIPSDERIVTIEDAVELQLQQEHVVRLESRPSNIEGRGEVTIRDLVRNSLRMRPDRIVVGECRGGEALDMLQAMNTGHDGSLSTVHANSPRDTISRLETLTLMAGMDLPLRAVREQIASAVDVIIHISRLRDGTRRVTHVTEVAGMENDVVTLQDVFLFDYRAGMDHTGRFVGTIRPTGVRPRFTERFAELGIPFDPAVFASEPR